MPRKVLKALILIVGLSIASGTAYYFKTRKKEKLQCQAFVISKFTGKVIDETFNATQIGPRALCKPLVYWDFGKNLCKKYESDPNFKGIQLEYFPNPVLRIENLCKDSPTYDAAVAKGDEIQKGRFLPPLRNEDLIRSFSPTEPTSVFRENIERTGVNSREVLSLKMEKQWQRPLNVGIHTASKGTPAIDNTGVYVGSDSSWFYAFDHQGNLRWKFFSSGANWGIHGTPILDRERVYIGTYNGTLYALKKEDGSVAWAYRLGLRLGASPTLYKNYLYANIETGSPMDGVLAKIRTDNGEIVWVSHRLGAQSHSSPTINSKTGLVYAGANNGSFYAFDLETGKTRWVYKTKKPIKTTSTLVGNEIFFSSWSKAIWALNAETGAMVWRTALKGISRSSPSFVPTLDYLVLADESGFIYGIDIHSGKIKWTRKSNVSPLISSALVVQVQKKNKNQWLAWIPCQSKTLCALDPANGSIVSQYGVGGELSSVPVAWQGALYLALEKEGGLVKLGAITE